MLFHKAATLGGIFIALAAGVSGSPARADDGVKATYESQVGYALHLLEAGRYGEAADAAQNLVMAYPDAALPYELRGATALYVGNSGRAQADFARAASADPAPAALYGLALAALLGGKTAAVREALTKARWRWQVRARTTPCAGRWSPWRPAAPTPRPGPCC